MNGSRIQSAGPQSIRFSVRLFCLWFGLYGPLSLAALAGPTSAATPFGTATPTAQARPTPPSPPNFAGPKIVGPETPGTPTGPTTLTKADLDSIPFLPSWNLISIPETPTVSTPSDVFASLDGSYSTVWFYDACDPSAEKWKVYDPSNPGGSTLSTLSPTQGLWLDATAASSLPSTGELPPTSTCSCAPAGT